MSVYENIRECCERHGKTVSGILKEIGRSTGSITAWKNGRLPNLDIVMEMADDMNVSLDELVYGFEYEQSRLQKFMNSRSGLSKEQLEILSVFARIPEERHSICIDFLRTHAVPEKEKAKIS